MCKTLRQTFAALKKRASQYERGPVGGEVGVAALDGGAGLAGVVQLVPLFGRGARGGLQVEGVVVGLGGRFAAGMRLPEERK